MQLLALFQMNEIRTRLVSRMGSSKIFRSSSSIVSPDEIKINDKMFSFYFSYQEDSFDILNTFVSFPQSLLSQGRQIAHTGQEISLLYGNLPTFSCFLNNFIPSWLHICHNFYTQYTISLTQVQE